MDSVDKPRPASRFLLSVDNTDRPTATADEVRITRSGGLQVLKASIGRATLEFSISSDTDGTLWAARPDEMEGAFIACLGWCRRRRDARPLLEVLDLVMINQRHGQQGRPPIEELSGSFCLISYHPSSSDLWVASDPWTVGGFFFSASPPRFEAGSSAAELAHRTGAPVDGLSYLAWLRNAVLPPGRTLFGGIHRIPLRTALRIEPGSGRCWLMPWYPWPEPEEDWSHSVCLDRMEQALELCIPAAVSDPRVVVDLTAGNDSRLTAATLASACREGRISPPPFRVVGKPSNPDIPGATAIAELMGWNLRHHLPIPPKELHAEILEPAALRGDTTFPFHEIANRWVRETRDWPDTVYHVGSLGGQLFRNWMWQYELLHPRRKTEIRRPALLRHRLYNYADVDCSRLSSGRIGQNEHDAFLLEGTDAIHAEAPDLLDLYKLERIHMQMLSQRSLFWCLSGIMHIVLPYLWTEITDVSLRIPWSMKKTRRLVLDFVSRHAPSLTVIPTDTGSPFRHLSILAAPEYSKYLTGWGWTVFQTHYAPRRHSSSPPPLSIPDSWLTLHREISSRFMPYDCSHIDGIARSRAREAPSRALIAEVLSLLHLRLLTGRFPGIRAALDFGARSIATPPFPLCVAGPDASEGA